MRAGPRASRPVLDFLNDGGPADRAAATLMPKVQRLLDLRADLSRLLPAPLADGCEAAGCEGGVLDLRTVSAGAAAKLRQTLPRIRDGLLERGWEVSSIRVRVQPRGAPADDAAHSVAGPAMSDGGVAAFTALAGALEDSPLRAAVDRLVARRRRRGADLP